MYASPATVLTPSNAGNLTILRANCGSTRANDMDLTAARFWMELELRGDRRYLATEGPPSKEERRPPALEEAYRRKSALLIGPLHLRGAHIFEGSLALIARMNRSSAAFAVVVDDARQMERGEKRMDRKEATVTVTVTASMVTGARRSDLPNRA
jgi:hypothetical protein